MKISAGFERAIEILRNEFALERSFNEKTCIDKNDNPIPWYTYPAIEYLSQFDYSDKSVFEYGCGYSSLFWAKRALEVISIEDNPEWYQKWQKNFDCNNLQVHLCDEGEDYYQAIFRENKKFDIIVIDGKCREKCADCAVKCINNGGIIILDDSDRVNTSQEYINAISCLKNNNLIQVDFYGFCPMNNYTKATSIFFMRDFNFNSINDRQPINGIGNLWGLKRKQRKEFYKENI